MSSGEGSVCRRAFAGTALMLLTVSPAMLAMPTGHAGAPSGVRGAVNGRAPGYLGIEVHDPSQPPAPAPPVRGVEVGMVDHDGPAGKAGLRPHDLILALNGQAVASADMLRRMIHDSGAGVQVALSVVRSGHPMTLTAQLADRQQVARAALARVVADPGPAPVTPAPVAEGEGEISGTVETYSIESAPLVPAPLPGPAEPTHTPGFFGSMLHGSPLMGVALDAMEPQLAGYFGAPRGTGLLVHSVVTGSPAAEAGLRAGDVVLSADAVTLHTATEWTRHLRGAKGRPVTLLILRQRREMLMTLPPELKHHSLLEWPVRERSEE